MTTKETPLVDIFYPQGSGIPDTVITSRVSPLPSLALAFPNLGTDILGAVQKDLKDSTDKMLKMTPLDILLEGWKKYAEVRKALEDSKKKPTEPILKPLVKHTITSTHKPYIELYMDEVMVKKIDFQVKASLEVESATLKILNGQVIQILGGTCLGKFELKHDDKTLTELKTAKFALPGSIRLQPEPVKQPAPQAQVAQVGEVKETPLEMARLNGLKGDVAGKIYRLTDGLVIGRSSSCSIRLSEPTISRHHARLRKASNHWFIQDMESATGIYVNGAKVEATALKSGDLIRIGKSEFEFHE